MSTQRLTQFQLTMQAPFNNGPELREDLTAAELFNVAFDAPNGYLVRAGASSAEEFFGNVVACIQDDIKVLRSAMLAELEPDSDVVERFLMRISHRLAVGREVAKRIARESEGGGS